MENIRHYVRCEYYLFLDEVQSFDLNEEDCFGNNLLAYASTKKMAKYLIGKGFSLANKNKYGEGLVLQSLKFKNPSLTWFLIKSGAPLPEKNQLILSKTLFSNSLIEYFLQQNFLVDESNINGETALIKLIRNCLNNIYHDKKNSLENYKVMETLIKNGAKVNHENKVGISPKLLIIKELERVTKKKSKIFSMFLRTNKKAVFEIEKIKDILKV